VTTRVPGIPGTAADGGLRRGAPFDPLGGRAAWTAWGLGCTVYFLAVVNRTSLGVAGLAAAARFHISASQLSAFSLLQLLVYAAMQIPTGLLVDRLGPRRVLTIGMALLTAGQLGFAFSSAFVPALLSRAVLGCGDAMTFVSVLRIGARWFPARRNPLMAQLTALVGVCGNLVSTAVLVRVLQGAGWTATFATVGLAGVGALALVAVGLRDTPDHPPRSLRALRGVLRPRRLLVGGGLTAVWLPGTIRAARPAVGSGPRGGLRRQIRAAWREPGTRLGLWVHFTSQFPATTFLLLWGLPFLVDGERLTTGTAGALLSTVVISNMGFGLLFGQLLSRRHTLRLPIVLTVLAATTVLWTVVLVWPGGRAPLWLLAVHAFVLGSNGAASIVGLDFARPVNPPERIGTASGIVNMGGFLATVFSVVGIGVLLDAADPGATGGHYTPHAFRIAFCVLALPMALGVSQILRLRRAAARREEALRAGAALVGSIPAAAAD
jgi:MFS family permease